MVAVIAASFTIMGNAYSAPKYVPFGVNFSPYVNGQTPLPGTLVIKTSQISSRLAHIRGDFQWIRTYSSTHGMETAGALAHKAGFKTALGAWIGPESTADGIASNEDEIVALVAAANRGEADMVIVGSEVLLRGDIAASKLVYYMQQVRASVPANIPVTTMDAYSSLIANPAVIAQCDAVLGSFYPFWEGTRIDGAVKALDAQYRSLVQASGSKPVWIAETGWPSAGNTVGAAVPSQQNEAYYFLGLNSYVRTNDIPCFYFEAYDEAWKTASEGPQGAHWGIWTATGTMKAGMNLVFQNYTLPYAAYMRTANSSSLPGQVSIQITTLSAYGSSDGIAGKVTGVNSGSYVVATYIDVFGGWWTKPYWDQPTVGINQDGTFSVNTVTGGYDNEATAYMVFLVPASYSPPSAGGGGIPGDIYSHALAYAYADRPVGFPGSVNNNTLTVIKSITVTRSWSSSTNAVDVASVSGTIPIVGTKPLGSYVDVSIGSMVWQFDPLSKTGAASITGANGTKQKSTVAFTYGKNAWTFSARLALAAGNADWTADGMLNESLSSPGIPVFIPVVVTVNGTDYGRLASGFYTAKKSKSGVFTGAAK